MGAAQENPRLTNDDPEIIRQRIAYVAVMCVVSVGLVHYAYDVRGVLAYEVRAPGTARPAGRRRP